MSETRLFAEGTIPECATAEWYHGREAAPHIDQGPHQHRMALAAQFVTDLVRDLEAVAVVDAGAGDGGMLSILAVPSGVDCYGYDLSPAAVQFAVSQRGVNVEQLDAVALAAEGHLTKLGDNRAVVIATEMLEHLVDPHGFLLDLHADPSVAAVVASSPWNETADAHYEFHLWAWDEEGYRALFERTGWTVQRQELGGFATVIAAVRGEL
jgi:2-polyprenyl-3-methyl-5-hydroxy-6-metoxy-1,4-benzoquinol methylase